MEEIFGVLCYLIASKLHFQKDTLEVMQREEPQRCKMIVRCF
jgi:hypothetical protein